MKNNKKKKNKHKQIRHECWAALAIAQDNPERAAEIIAKVRAKLFVPSLNKPISIPIGKGYEDGVELLKQPFVEAEKWLNNED